MAWQASDPASRLQSIKLREFEKWKLNELVHNRQVKGLRIGSPEGCAFDPLFEAPEPARVDS